MPVTLSRSVALWNSSAVARRPKLIGHQRKEAIARREAGETLRDLPGPTLLVAFNMTLHVRFPPKADIRQYE